VMRQKAYTARSIDGAQSYCRMLLKQRQRAQSLLSQFANANKRLKEDRKQLAKLAAEGPCFDNPLVIYEVKQLRDQILRDECGLNPDGTFLAELK
jgi:hypothetical protein